MIATGYPTILNESKSAPLYHNTSVDKAVKIILSNIFRVGAGGNADNNAVCFTRDKNFQFGLVRFEIDQEKLVQNYKFKQVNFYQDRSESEERIYSDIKNARKYILSVDISEGGSNAKVLKKIYSELDFLTADGYEVDKSRFSALIYGVIGLVDAVREYQIPMSE